MNRTIKVDFTYLRKGNGGPEEGLGPFKLHKTKEVQSKRIVCERCEGEGSHVNPNIDGHGLTQEDLERDPEFKQNYLSGAYDIECKDCKGDRVVDVIDIESLSYEDKEAYQRNQDDIRYAKNEYYYERQAFGLTD